MGAHGAIYHERQIRELCALHALNNLFQAKGSFTKTELDDICVQLSPDEWINPHKSMLGLGQYDVNVIMTALQLRNYEAIWFDKRKEPLCIDTSNILGFIMNVPSEYKFGFIVLPFRRRHWIAIRKIDKFYWNLDSKLNAPECIGDDADVITYLTNQFKSNDMELFVIVKSDMAKSKRWLKDDSHQ
ncbi:josephin-like protein [Contarinia nasturtii]|uniref:josephin-like protein n=1 Tax=Contarinia nasturtii TaxID=265458 RepID=UPI0012D3C8B6|nr:josephin-like protein [Contarinia nasturtii]